MALDPRITLASLQQFSDLYKSNPQDPYFQLYGAYPSDVTGEEDWLTRAISGGDAMAQQQAAQDKGFLGDLGPILGIGGLALGGLGLAGIGPFSGLGSLFSGASGAADAALGAGATGATSATGAGLGGITNAIGDATGAFDMAGSAGVFDSLGNPLYSSAIGSATPGVGDAGAFDQFGSIASPTGTGVGGTIFDPASQALINGTSSSGFDWQKLLFGNQGVSGLLGPGGLLGNRGLLGLAGSTVPGLLALDYAKSQPAVDTSQLQSVYSQAGANTPGFVQAAIDPFQQNIAAGYGDLLQSQAQRGIRGSSFGDTDIANYLSTTGRALSGAGSTAQQQALGLQGNLAGQIASLNAQNQQIKNQLYGRAFDIFGRGLSPSPYAWVGSTGGQ